MRRIYLDYNATTPILPEALEAVADCQRRLPGNPASQHQSGRAARHALEDAREAIAEMLGAKTSGPAADRLIFTSGGTEANNLAVLGIAAARPRSGAEAIVSAIEHPSVAEAAKELARRGWTVHTLPVDAAGVVHASALEELLSPRTSVVSVLSASNETGVVQPVGELGDLARAAGVPIHTDAAQLAGKLPIDFRRLGVSALTVAAHKFYGPLGIGALLLRHDVPLAPQTFGGAQQLGLRAGTEPLALAVGMRAALAAVLRDTEDQFVRLERLRDRFEGGLQSLYPSLVINGATAPRLPHTSSVAFVGLDRQAVLVALDLAGIDCSTGSACASGSSEPSPVLRAMGCPDEVVASSLRFSLGRDTTEADVDEAIARIGSICQRLAASRSATPLPAVAG